MNKLRKPSSALPKSPLPKKFAIFPNPMATSMTMQYAAIPNSTSASATTERASRSVATTWESDEQIFAATDQHWVARALRAEALLAAHAVHREEVKTLNLHQEAKRQHELTMVAKGYREKREVLERLLAFLLVLIAVLVILIVYLATYYVRHSIPPEQRYTPSWWSAIGPSHFTIPILSPFTSVVEHESSIIGPKSIGTFAAISACLIYLIFRYWISSRTAKFTTTSISSSASSAARAIWSTTSHANR